MKITNFIFIISLLIACSYQETVQETLTESSENKMEENTEEQTENKTDIEILSEAENLSAAVEQLGTEEELEEEMEEETIAAMMGNFPANYFVGDWLMYGLTCNKNTPKVEKCSCAMKDKIVICTKTLGDDCVTTGTETFRSSGDLPAQLQNGKKMKITYTVGSAKKPNSGKWRNAMKIINKNTFISGKRKYVRISPPKPAVEPTIRPSPNNLLNILGSTTTTTVKAPVKAVEPNNLLNILGSTTTTTVKAPAKIEPNNLLKLLGSTTTTTTTSGTKGTAPVKAVEPTTRPSINSAKAPFFKPIAPAPVLPLAPTVTAAKTVYYYANYFLGNWNVVGYVCDETTPAIEVVNIKYNKGNMYATKLLGDLCVPAKKLSFEAPIPGKLYQGLSFPVKFTVGSPKFPAAKQVPNTIRIKDMNTFEIPRHIFYRVIGPDAPKPHGVYINMKPIVGKGAYPGPNVIKLNPKTNMRSPVRRFVIVEESTRKPAN